MRIKDIFDFVEDYSLGNCDILDVQIARSDKKIVMTIAADVLIEKEELFRLEDKIREDYAANAVQFLVKYRDVKFERSYLAEVVRYINRVMPLSNGFFKDAEIRIDGNRIDFLLQYGGIEILQENHCERICEQLILDEFGEEYHVTLSHNQAEEENPYEAKIEEQKEAVRQALAQNKPESQKKKKAVVVNNGGALFGKPFTGEVDSITEVDMNSGRVILEGFVFNTDSRELRNNRMLYIFCITDNHYSLKCKIITDQKNKEQVFSIKSGMAVRVRGDMQYDSYERETIVMVRDAVEINIPGREDTAEEKRVELHCHTKMSAMDGFASIGDLVKQAAHFGHKALAVTDHGVLQAFPDAHIAGKKNGVKMIYGVEAYFVDDCKTIVYGEGTGSLAGEFVVFDLETTGLSSQNDTIIEIGAVKVKNAEIIDRFSTFVNPKIPIPDKITQLTSITDAMVQDAPDLDTVLPQFLEFVGEAPVVAHNAMFDTGFINKACEDRGIAFHNTILDTVDLSRNLLPDLKRHKLNLVADHLNIKLENHHRAVDDAEVTALIFIRFIGMLKEKGIEQIEQINAAFSENADTSKLPSYHAIILAKNYQGLFNLYNIVSQSHLNYFYKKPRVPKSLYLKYKEGLMIGSACEAGQLYRALVENKPNNVINDIAKFYDYYEIQPLMNNEFMIRNGTVNGPEDLQELNKKIIELGDYYKKPVVATCDVHFLNPEDAIFREVIMTAQGFNDAAYQPPLYFRSTNEMLDEFTYLPREKAYEIVVTNTNKLADMCEEILPVPDGTYPPEIEGAADDILRMSYDKAREIYGDELPDIVQQRMDKELNSIIKHGFAVMYMIAQKLVSKSLSDGYLVGSRGSVGSSLIAFLAGITEVNSLEPHYICPNCKNSEFITDGSYSSGFDMPDKNCPKCGTKYKKDGHDIPFETFLGFDGDKEPDIDLNFSGDYQPVAHKYTEELFGEGNVFRAGTIGTIAEKTAYGFVKKYMEVREKNINNAEIDRLVKGCTGVKRTTGQHPGGVMIVPRDNNVHNFTPIQHPADDRDSGIITTHFDYHSISGRLLKLDILGHDDPTVIRMLEDLTGLDAKKIPLDDPETMSLFLSPDALGVTPEQINSPVGTYGVPEFGTKFVREMLVDTKPKTFGELVRISGLSHGTDVWLNNAKDLIAQGIELKDTICTRDDIMTDLIRMGLPKKESFKIMEAVRKGKGLTEEFESLMRENDVPEWYIDSCKKIKYMFPKAHAVAYVTMAFRIAYCKVHYPLEYYATYFTVRADDFDAEKMIFGVQRVKNTIDELNRIDGKLSQKEKSMMTILEMCLEMYSRGYEFLGIDLYESEAKKFKIKDGKILPPLNAIAGLGETAAENVVKARNEERFMSVDDLQVRSKLSKTIIEIMENQGILNGMPKSSQVSLFDMMG